MYQRNYRSSSSSINIWPGFVDALSALLLVIMFVLLIFVVAQYYLNEDLMRKDKSLNSFQEEIQKLTSQLIFIQGSKKELETKLTNSLQVKEVLNKQVQALEGNYQNSQKELKVKNLELLDTAQQLNFLNKQLSTFNEQVQKLNTALKVSEEKVQVQQNQIEDLKINEALVAKIQEMSKYRSEFFESLEAALGDRDDTRIEGDRFVFKSAVLFKSASDKLSSDGIEALNKLAQSLKEIILKIPSHVNWVLCINGHTDKRPIRSKFRSNWELSFGRAMEVTRHLMKQGIPANRLAATGFGSNYPMDSRNTEEAYQKNRRIEIKFCPSPPIIEVYIEVPDLLFLLIFKNRGSFFQESFHPFFLIFQRKCGVK